MRNPNPRAGLRSVPNNCCAASAFAAQRSSQRATIPSTSAASRRRAAASASFASKFRSDRRLLKSFWAFILPSCQCGGGSGPAPRVTALLRGSARIRAEHSDPASSRTCTTKRPAERAAGGQSLRCVCVRCASRSSRVRQFQPRRISGSSKRRESSARQTFLFTRCEIHALWKFSYAGASGRVGKFQAGVIRPDSQNEPEITPPPAGTPGSRLESITTS